MPDNIVFSTDVATDLSHFLGKKKYSKTGVITDENTLRHCYPAIADSLPEHSVITITSGEEHKNLATCTTIWQQLTDHAFDRHSVVIVLGGGVAGDMGGFCAATFKRGIDFVLVPTTLLAQVDASIGGKLGIDFNHFKNHIGVFRFPVLTILFTPFLKTLPEAELRSGFAEVIKHALISDKGLWDEIRSKAFALQDWEKLIRHSLAFKSRIVSEDPHEKGLRKVLNAGHTIGHALESHLLGSNGKILHGEAIAAGLIAESFIARQKGLLSDDSLHDITRYITAQFGKVRFGARDEEAIAALTVQDKKNSGNKILCVLLDGIGKAKWDCEISPEEVKRALSFYRSI